MRFHGGGYYNELLDFSANLNPLAPPGILLEELEKNYREEIYRFYPDSNYSELKHAIAYFYDLDEKNIVACNGASEALNLAVIALRPKRLLVVSPSYGDYDLLCKGLGMECKHILMREKEEEFMSDSNDLITEAKASGKGIAIVMTNPNNPTGMIFSSEFLKEIAEELRNNAWIIVDEVYAELSNYKGLLGSELENLLIVRSFTKLFGVPGLRLGFLYIPSRELAEKIDSIRPTWNIGTIAEKTFKQLLINHRAELWNFIKQSSEYIRRERERLSSMLLKIGYRVYNSRANFLLLKHQWIDSLTLRDKLFKEYGVRVRPAHTFKGLTRHHTRIAVRKTNENNLLVKALEKLVSEV